MKTVHLEPMPLTQERFSRFGDVIEIGRGERILINQGTTERFHALATIDTEHQGGRPILSIFRATARPAPIKIALMERHPLGSQAFYPLQNAPWLVVVSAAAVPAPENLEAFWARGDQGVQYARNVWHHPLLVIEPTQDFLVADRAGDGDNLEEVQFETGTAFLNAPRLDR